MRQTPSTRPAETHPTTETVSGTGVTKYNRVEDVPVAIIGLLNVINSTSQLLERTGDNTNVKRHGWGILSTTAIHDGKKLYLADRQADLAISVDPEHVGGIRFFAKLLGGSTDYKPGRSGHQINERASQAVTCSVQPARPGEPESIQIEVVRAVDPSDAANRLPNGEQAALTAADLATVDQLSGVITRLARQYGGDFSVVPALLLTRAAMDARAAALPPGIVR